MPSFTDHPSSNRVKALIAGPSGSGKTGLLASLANAGYKLRILDVDNGLDILRNYLTPEGMENVRYVTLKAKNADSWIDMQAALKDFDGLGPVSGFGPDEVFVIDSASFLCDCCLSDILRTHKVAVDAANFDRGLYNVLFKRFENLVSYLTSEEVKCNLILTAHTRDVEDKNTGRVEQYPYFEGQKLIKVIPRYLNNMWRIDVKPDGKRVLRTTADSKMGLKSSAPSALKPEEEFDLAKIFAKIKK